MDSTGIGALVELSKVSEHQGRTFDIVAMSPRVRRVLEVTGLQDAWQLA
jgi:anti-anti-sigma factor